MMKAGLIDEMMNDALDSALDTDNMEEETEEQINQVSTWAACLVFCAVVISWPWVKINVLRT